MKNLAMKNLALLTLTALIAVSQSAERIFPFTQLQTPAQFAETATVIRSLGEIRDLTVDAAQKTMTVRGDATQVELAAWLFSRLDRGAAMDDSPPADYRPATGNDDVVRLFYFKVPASNANMNHMATAVRSLVEIRQAFVSNAAGVFVARGTLAQMDAAKWMMEALEQRKPGVEAATYRMPDAAGEGAIRLFTVTEASSEQQFQEMVVALRTSSQIRRVFSYYPVRAIAVRGTDAQMEQAAGLLRKP
jgi:hypothetical protein